MSISAFSSAMVRAAVAWSRISPSAASTSSSGASSRSSTSSAQIEAPVQLVLPLFGEAARANDQSVLKVAADDQLFDQKAGHDCLTRAGIVREEEAQRLARQHRLVHRPDLMRQRLDHRRVDRQDRI